MCFIENGGHPTFILLTSPNLRLASCHQLIRKESQRNPCFFFFDIHMAVIFHHFKTNRNDSSLKLQVPFVDDFLRPYMERFLKGALCARFL